MPHAVLCCCHDGPALSMLLAALQAPAPRLIACEWLLAIQHASIVQWPAENAYLQELPRQRWMAAAPAAAALAAPRATPRLPACPPRCRLCAAGTTCLPWPAPTAMLPLESRTTLMARACRPPPTVCTRTRRRPLPRCRRCAAGRRHTARVRRAGCLHLLLGWPQASADCRSGSMPKATCRAKWRCLVLCPSHAGGSLFASAFSPSPRAPRQAPSLPAPPRAAPAGGASLGARSASSGGTLGDHASIFREVDRMLEAMF